MPFSNAASFPVLPEREVTMFYANVLISPLGLRRLYPRKAVKVPWRMENMFCARYNQRSLLVNSYTGKPTYLLSYP